MGGAQCEIPEFRRVSSLWARHLQKQREPDEDFNMEGDERYTYEFAMPPSDSLYVMVGGTEIDHANLDDTLGYVEHSYDIYQNWGSRSAVYEDSSGEDAAMCDDTFCVRCSSGLFARWRITRIH